MRITLDADFSLSSEKSISELEKMVKEICVVDVEPDGMEFDLSTVKGEKIRDQAAYSGIRIKLKGRLGKAKIPLQLDIGFGDSLVPAPQEIEYPPLLEFQAPRLKGYCPETTVAEKLQFMVAEGLFNSRMKDYYDIWFISRVYSFNGDRLAEAVRETFKRRKTEVPDRVPDGLNDRFSTDKDKINQWKGFANKLELQLEKMTLTDIVVAVREFCYPILEALSEHRRFLQHWQPGGPWVQGENKNA